jgi:pectate lyase
VYNNFYDVDRRNNLPPGNASVEYRLGDTRATGTAAKLYTENNLFEIRNNSGGSALNVPRIINYASTVANRDQCVSVGYSLEDCGTYYGNVGTWVTMIGINTAGTITATGVTEHDAFTALQGIQDDSSANAPLMKLDPADPAVYWIPRQSYDYTALPVVSPDGDPAQGAALRAALRASIVAGAGAGKL